MFPHNCEKKLIYVRTQKEWGEKGGLEIYFYNVR